MKISFNPDDTELELRIGDGVLSFIDGETIVEIDLSESDMLYLKKRLSEWNPSIDFDKEK